MIERLAQRSAPGLVPARLATRVTVAVGVPAANAVGTTPSRVLDDLDFVSGRIDGEVFGVIRELGQLVGFDVMQRIGERHLALEMMMAVRLAIGRNVHE